MSKKEQGLENVRLSGGKRSHLTPAEEDGDWDWWVGWGKSQDCQFEGPWLHMAVIAAKILRHPNTARVAPNLHQPNIALTEEQETMY